MGGDVEGPQAGMADPFASEAGTTENHRPGSNGSLEERLPFPDDSHQSGPETRFNALLQKHEDSMVYRIEQLLCDQLGAQPTSGIEQSGSDFQSWRKQHGHAEHVANIRLSGSSKGTPSASKSGDKLAAASKSDDKLGAASLPQQEAAPAASSAKDSIEDQAKTNDHCKKSSTWGVGDLAKRFSIGGNAAVPPDKVNERSSTVPHVQAPDMVSGALDLRKKFKRPPSPFDKTSSLALEKFAAKNPIRGWMRKVTVHPFFDTFFAGVVVFSLIMIGYEIEAKSIDPHFESNIFLISQGICCFFFFIEVAFRVGGQGIKFICSKEYKWNIFDLTCLITMMIELTSEATLKLQAQQQPQADDSLSTRENAATSGRILRVLRLVRIVRALRIMRATRASREFRKMSYALQYSAQTLFWALLLLCFVMYFFAATFTQAVAEVLWLHDILPAEVQMAGEFGPLVMTYGSIPRSFQSLFMAISSGRDWHELVTPLQDHLHWGFSALFIMFIAVTVFGIMNVLTSVFVESALQSVQHYKELLIQESMKAKTMYIEHLREVFREIDSDLSGEITLAEMEQFLTDPSLVMYLESMDIQPDDARTLFRLLDKDDSGCISIEEFCQGCLRLKGDAKSFDIHCIIFENHRLLFKWKEYMTFMETGFVPTIKKAVESVEPAVKFGVQGVLEARLEHMEKTFGLTLRRELDSVFDRRVGVADEVQVTVTPRMDLQSEQSEPKKAALPEDLPGIGPESLPSVFKIPRMESM